MLAFTPQHTESARRVRSDRLCLMVLAEGRVTAHELPTHGRVIVGREPGPNTTIVIPSSQVSRQHAAIDVERGKIWIEDLGSTNGTRLRDDAVTSGARKLVMVGDSIELGTVLALVQYLPEAAVGRSGAMVPDDAGPIVIDPAMVALYRMVDRLAAASLPVMLLGETGVGKEVIAEQLHIRSPRRDKPLIRLNCAAFTEPLLESELFGHVRGAFTGANHNKPGLFVAADGGTVFLDEVGELPLALQAKLLRVLESGEVLPVGAITPTAVDVRFVSATNADLDAAIVHGKFREDLFHRLDGATLVIPPLRERPGEIGPLAQRFLQRAARRHDLAVPVLAADALAWIASYSWPGNVRELRHVMERALLFANNETITAAHLRQPNARHGPIAQLPTPPPSTSDPEHGRTLAALAHCNGNQTRAARMLGIARSTLLKRLDRYNVPRPRRP